MTPKTQAAGADYLAALAESNRLNGAAHARQDSLEKDGISFREIYGVTDGPPALQPEGWQRDLALLKEARTAAGRATSAAKVALDRMLLTEDGTPCAAALAAAKWWADCTRGHGPLGSSGDGMIDALFALTGANRPKGAASDSDRFEAALAEDIDARLRRTLANGYDNVSSYDVDYGPSCELGDLAVKFGVGGFPIKTHMSITASLVTVSAGYRAPSGVVYEADEIKQSPALKEV